jgi:hypothetical protein
MQGSKKDMPKLINTEGVAMQEAGGTCASNTTCSTRLSMLLPRSAALLIDWTSP